MLTKIAKTAYISTVKVGIEALSVTAFLRRRNVETMNTIGIIVVAMLVVIVAVVTTQWDKEAQIRKLYEKYLNKVEEDNKRLNVKAKTFQVENIELEKQLSSAKNDIKVVEDTYKDRIYSLEAKLLEYQRENDKLASEIIEAHYQKQLENGELEFREPAEAQEDEEQEAEN